ncbi:MAG: LysR family transcriptional regulator [Acholeplasmatales bacterium]|nr:LysR family transcriptional regulator [Acholeplasmatales bacterium]
MLDQKLITFLTLMEEGSYTKTADRLNFTQPAITHHIKQLEKLYNIELFEDFKSLELTRAGKILYEYAKNQKISDEQLFNNLKSGEGDKTYKLGMTPMVLNSIINTRTLDYFYNKKKYFDFYSLSNQDIEKNILQGNLDFAIIDSSFDSSQFNNVYLQSSHIILVCKKDGAYENKDRITREMLSKAIIILPDEKSGLDLACEAALKNKNIRLKDNTIVRSNNPDLMIKMVKEYDGIAFVYRDSVRRYLNEGDIKEIELINFTPTQNFYLIYSKNTFIDDDFKKMLPKDRMYYDE